MVEKWASLGLPVIRWYHSILYYIIVYTGYERVSHAFGKLQQRSPEAPPSGRLGVDLGFTVYIGFDLLLGLIQVDRAYVRFYWF